MPDLPPSLPGVTHRQVDVGGLSVHVAEAGEGEPVVLVHGWPQHWWCWREVLPRLAERYRVVCPDLRGHGWTAAPPSGYEKERLATDLLALLDELGLDRVRVAGHDWGGFAAFLAALRAPDRFHSLLALSITHPWPVRSSDPRDLLRLAYQLPLAAPVAGPHVVRRTPIVREVLRRGRVAGEWDERDLDLYVSRFREPARAAATTALYRTFLTREALPLARGEYAGRRLVVPTRLVVGARDPVFAGNPLDGWQDRADDMDLEWIPGVGHFLPEEAPGIVADRALALFGGAA